MSITLNPKDLERAERLLKGIKGGAHKAVNRALNRTAQQTRNQITKSVTERYRIKAGEVKSTVSVQKAKPQTLEAMIEVKSYKIPLSHFGVSPKRDTTGFPHRKVKVEVLKGSPFESRQGFVWKGDVFHRKTTRRLPLEVTAGPATPQMVGSEEVIGKVEQFAEEVLHNRLNHEITVLLEGYGKK